VSIWLNGQENPKDAAILIDMQTHEIRASTGFFNRSVTCRISEKGKEIVQDRDVKRIGYDKLSGSRFHRRGAGR
jgi:hypothetical protein